ncbi:hypothetical protein Taro_026012 [Colocasia esculenta]|uniref:Uncharacterized protein n=1 Tax=Colocasia esculenta TaxID=4460 RepID=A0A843VI98_COLES|nr:hypothetical protein [Colocasia esculenta]
MVVRTVALSLLQSSRGWTGTPSSSLLFPGETSQQWQGARQAEETGRQQSGVCREVHSRTETRPEVGCDGTHVYHLERGRGEGHRLGQRDLAASTAAAATGKSLLQVAVVVQLPLRPAQAVPAAPGFARSLGSCLLAGAIGAGSRSASPGLQSSQSSRELSRVVRRQFTAPVRLLSSDRARARQRRRGVGGVGRLTRHRHRCIGIHLVKHSPAPQGGVVLK